jgi:hypothetical protein
MVKALRNSSKQIRHGSFGQKKLLYKLAESGGAFGDSKWQKLLNLARQTPFSTAFELVFKVLAVRKCKGVFASYEIEMNHATNSNFDERMLLHTISTSLAHPSL